MDIDLAAIPILHGKHPTFGQGACALELVDALDRSRRGLLVDASTLLTDHPACVCPVLRDTVIAWNDAIKDDATRTSILGPFIPRLLGTVSTKAVEVRRSYLAIDWLIRIYTPTWLELSGIDAKAIRALPEIKTLEDLQNAQAIITADESAARSADESATWSAAWSVAWRAVESAAWNAARSAAESAARSAAWRAAESAARSAAWHAARSAARSAAESAARSAAWRAAESAARSAAWHAAESAAESAARIAARGAARSAAESAAWIAARSAAESATESAAESALAPTVEALQLSFCDCLDRMIKES